MTKLAIILTATFLYTQESPAVQPELSRTNDPTNSIMQKVKDRAQKNDLEKQKHLAYLRAYEAYNLTPDGKQKDRDDQSVTRIRPNGNKSIEEIIEEDGKPVLKNSPDDNVFDLRVTLERWQFTIANPSIIDEDGKDYIVINFKPKDGKLPDKTYLDSIINDLQGTFYIDMENLYIKKMDGTLIRPLSFGGGLVKSIEITVHIEQEQRLDLNNLVVVNAVTAIPRYTINYILYRRDRYQKRIWTYTDYKYVP